MNKITVLGSLNVDTILKINEFAKPGETIHVNEKSSAAGGKGANQAVAAARAEAKTTFIGKIGNDSAGTFMLNSLKNDGINCSYVNTTEQVGTGTANIMIDENGQNCILVYGGANQALTPEDINNAKSAIEDSDFIIAQFETPQDTALEAFKIAKNAGVVTVLNPAPAPNEAINKNLLNITDIIIPNELESASITGIKIDDENSMINSAQKFKSMGVNNLIITVGPKGAFYYTKNGYGMVPAFDAEVVDTTAAGDTFIGALISQLKPNLSNMNSSVTFAQHASSITIQKLGAQPSIPKLTDILESATTNETALV